MFVQSNSLNLVKKSLHRQPNIVKEIVSNKFEKKISLITDLLLLLFFIFLLFSFFLGLWFFFHFLIHHFVKCMRGEVVNLSILKTKADKVYEHLQDHVHDNCSHSVIDSGTRTFYQYNRMHINVFKPGFWFCPALKFNISVFQFNYVSIFYKAFKKYSMYMFMYIMFNFTELLSKFLFRHKFYICKHYICLH